MRKRTGAIIGGVIAAALITSCVMVGVAWYFADGSEQQEGKEVSHPVAGMGEAFRN